ncbi:MAG: MerC domain-containing protein [Bdellovibrionales bacterium]
MSGATHKEHNHNPSPSLDWLGLGLSGLCTLHCLALPFLISLLPAVEALDHHGYFHLVMAILIVPLGMIAFWRGYRQHKQVWVLLVGMLGLALITVGLLKTSANEHSPLNSTNTLLTVLGSIALMFTHYQNWRLSRRCLACHSEQA